MPKQQPTLVQYYRNGWRTGYLVKRGWKKTRIKKILAIHSTTKREFVTVLTADTREVSA